MNFVYPAHAGMTGIDLIKCKEKDKFLERRYQKWQV